MFQIDAYMHLLAIVIFGRGGGLRGTPPLLEHRVKIMFELTSSHIYGSYMAIGGCLHFSFQTGL